MILVFVASVLSNNTQLLARCSGGGRGTGHPVPPVTLQRHLTMLFEFDCANLSGLASLMFDEISCFLYINVITRKLFVEFLFIKC